MIICHIHLTSRKQGDEERREGPKNTDAHGRNGHYLAVVAAEFPYDAPRGDVPVEDLPVAAAGTELRIVAAKQEQGEDQESLLPPGTLIGGIARVAGTW